MIEAVIQALIYICVLALVVYLVIWVVTEVLGVPIPPKVLQIIWIIVALVVLLVLIRLLPIGKLAKDQDRLVAASTAQATHYDANGGPARQRGVNQ